MRRPIVVEKSRQCGLIMRGEAKLVQITARVPNHTKSSRPHTGSGSAQTDAQTHPDWPATRFGVVSCSAGRRGMLAPNQEEPRVIPDDG